MKKTYTLVAFKQYDIIDHHYCDIKDAEMLVETNLTKNKLVERTIELASELNDVCKSSWEDFYWFEDSSWDLNEDKYRALEKAKEIKYQKEIERDRRWAEERKAKEAANIKKEKEKLLEFIKNNPDFLKEAENHVNK